MFAIFTKFARIANFYGPPYCFVLCPVGDCGKIFIFAIFAKFANMFSFLPFLLLCAFLDISPRRGYRSGQLERYTRGNGESSDDFL